MLEARNVGTVTGGLVADPEVITARSGMEIVKLRLGVDFAGSEGGSAVSGYFDVVFYAGADNPNARFVLGQLRDGKMKRGSSVQILYRLNHDRWEDKDGSKRSKVVLVAESINYAGSRAPESTDGETRSETTETVPVPAQW